jgi:cytochrome c oxidase subunit II
MRRSFGQNWTLSARVIAALLLLFLTTACSSESPSTLEPAGPGARRIEGIWWVLFWIATAVVVIVAGMLVMSIRRASKKDEGGVDRKKPRWGEPFIVVTGVIVPVVILLGTFVFSLTQMNSLAASGEDAEIEIVVEAQNWWWEATYPNGAETANEIHIPTGEPVKIVLTSPDVVHSFWVPQLQAKMDNVPGQENSLWLEADEPGRYRGQCAEFCGLQHAHMAFFVVAQSPDEFDTWLANEAADATTPSSTTAQAGEEVFLGDTCVGCHAVRGTEADSDVGPDLTHLAGRETIGAGKLLNSRENLERFIVDPQGAKPGIGMPPTELTDEDLSDLLDYLEQLD